MKEYNLNLNSEYPNDFGLPRENFSEKDVLRKYTVQFPRISHVIKAYNVQSAYAFAVKMVGISETLNQPCKIYEEEE